MQPQLHMHLPLPQKWVNNAVLKLISGGADPGRCEASLVSPPLHCGIHGYKFRFAECSMAGSLTTEAIYM